MIDFDMLDKDSMKIDGFDDAIIGYGEQDDFAQFNILNVWVGNGTPMILYNEYWYDWKDNESSS